MAPLEDSQSKKQITLDLGLHSNHTSFHLFFAGAHAFKSREHRKSLKRLLDPPLRPLVLFGHRHTRTSRSSWGFLLVHSHSRQPIATWNGQNNLNQLAEAILLSMWNTFVTLIHKNESENMFHASNGQGVKSLWHPISLANETRPLLLLFNSLESEA